jgi:hypothetical protein
MNILHNLPLSYLMRRKALIEYTDAREIQRRMQQANKIQWFWQRPVWLNNIFLVN